VIFLSVFQVEWNSVELQCAELRSLESRAETSGIGSLISRECGLDVGREIEDSSCGRTPSPPEEDVSGSGSSPPSLKKSSGSGPIPPSLVEASAPVDPQSGPVVKRIRTVPPHVRKKPVSGVLQFERVRKSCVF